MVRNGTESIRLRGRIFLEMEVLAVTGLRIGGKPAGLGIGSMDNPVIRNPLTQEPYIPGSSLRGKMRSLWERYTGVVQNFPVSRKNGVWIHSLADNATSQDYENDAVCRIFGSTGDSNVANPTRLIVQDTFLNDDSVRRLEAADTAQPYTETKWEAAIDRITSAAVPRQMERVPAGVVFSPCRLVYNVYGTLNGGLGDIDWFFDVLTMLMLVEDDYLGSAGSRGSGQVRFQKLKLTVRSTTNYDIVHSPLNDVNATVDAVAPFLDARLDMTQFLNDRLGR